MRRVSKALMVSTAALLLLVGGSSVASQDVHEPTADVRALQDGDAGSYHVVYAGDWRYDGRAEGVPTEGPRFEVLDAQDVRDSGGRVIEASPVLWHSEGTTLRPGGGTPTWHSLQLQHWFLDGTIIATQERMDRARGGLVEHDEILTYDAYRDCILSGPGNEAVTATDCIVQGMRVRLPAGTPLTVSDETVNGLRLRHVSAAGPVAMDWWYAADVPVPIKFHFETVGPHQEPRTATYTLRGFQHGDGADMPRGTAIVAQPVQTAPLEVWGLSDAGIDHPFRLSRAFDEALQSSTFKDLRDWLRYHPDGYVFSAAYHEDRSGRETLRGWDLHLSDGHDGFSVRVSQSDDIHLLALGGFRIQRIEASDLAAEAPERIRIGEVPTIASVWQRWERHVSAAERNHGANAWGFEILSDADGDPVVRIAGGRATSVQWGPEGLALLGLFPNGDDVSLLTMDGAGQTVRFERHASGPAEHMATPTRAAPVTVHGYGATGWSIPALDDAVRLGVLATALGALYLSWPLLKGGGLALFSRLRPHELLDDPTRATIMDALAGEPGLHFRALCDRLGANPGRIRHHVHKLEQGGLIRARQTPGYTCYFPAATSRTVLDAGPLLRSEGARHILAAISRTPGACSKDLAAAAGLSPATATYHIKRLQQAGVIDSTRDGRATRIRLTPGGSQAVDALNVA